MSVIFWSFQLLPVVFIGVFAWSIVRAVNAGKKRGQGTKPQPEAGYGSTAQMNRNAQPYSEQKYSPQMGRNTSKTQQKSAAAKQANTVKQAESGSEKEMSTLEYLEERARQDQIEHAEEERRQRILDKQKRGGASQGVRLYEGERTGGYAPCKMRLLRSR